MSRSSSSGEKGGYVLRLEEQQESREGQKQVVIGLPASAGDVGSIPGSGRFPGVGNGNPPQHSCLENSMGRGAWQATVHSIAESDTTE